MYVCFNQIDWQKESQLIKLIIEELLDFSANKISIGIRPYWGHHWFGLFLWARLNSGVGLICGQIVILENCLIGKCMSHE